MGSNFKLTITEPEGILVPDTGAFTGGHDGSVAIMIGIGVIVGILVLFYVSSIILARRKSHRVFSQGYNSMKLHSAKNTFISSLIITLAVTGTLFAFANSETVDPAQVSAATSNTLTLKTEDIILDIAREDETAYGSVANKVTVNSGTSNGYTLGVYASGTNIVSDKDKEKTIATLPDAASPATLSENTWGVAITSPESETSKVWHAMPTSQDNMLTIKSSSTETPENDTTTVYYGAFINDELPSGDYTGPTINYIAVANVSPDILDELTVEEKVAQLIVTHAHEYDSFITNTGLAPSGVIFLYQDEFTNDRASMKQKINGFQSRSNEKLIVAIDEEGGDHSRAASYNENLCPRVDAPALLTSAEAARGAGSTIGECLDAMGFNVNFAPVADTLYESSSTVLRDRVFANSSNPNEVAVLANAFREGLESKGVIATYKHFPGHGSVAGDTHLEAAVAQKSWSSFVNEDIIPFKDGIDRGLNIIMAAHIITADSDGIPVSMSSKYLQTHLRQDLGFDGLIVTDALVMAAAKNYSSNPALDAFKAGADILLQPEDPVQAYNSVLNAVKSGEISEGRLNESVQRILRVKKLLH